MGFLGQGGNWGTSDSEVESAGRGDSRRVLMSTLGGFSTLTEIDSVAGGSL